MPLVGMTNSGALQPGLALGALLGERGTVGQFLVVHGDVGGRLHRDHLHAAVGGADRTGRRGLGGQDGLGLECRWASMAECAAAAAAPAAIAPIKTRPLEWRR